LFNRVSQTESDSDSSLWWRFFAALSVVPGVLKDLRILCRSTISQSRYSARSSKILERADGIHRALNEGHFLYQNNPPQSPSLFDIPTFAESSDRVRLRGFFIYTTMYICRVRATLSQNESDRAASEKEAQTFATQALLIEKASVNLDPAMNWHMEQRNALSHSIKRTREEWQSDEIGEISGEMLTKYLAQRWIKWEDSWRNGALTEALAVTPDNT
jgi:hypothetical protein